MTYEKHASGVSDRNKINRPLRMLRIRGTFLVSRDSGILCRLALHSDRGAAVLPGGDPQRAIRARVHYAFAAEECYLGADTEVRAARADTDRLTDPIKCACADSLPTWAAHSFCLGIAGCGSG